MTSRGQRTVLPLGAVLLLAACATIGPPKPPSLDLPKPPTDLKAVRKGDRVILTWTVPTLTTDRQTIRVAGATRICRALEKLTACGTPIAQIPTPLVGKQPSPSKQPKLSAAYTDALPPDLESPDPSAQIVYAVEVLNPDLRAADRSNQVQVSAFRPPAPPSDFQARLTGAGVVLSWSDDPSRRKVPGVRYLFRIYRHQEGEAHDVLLTEMPVRDELSFTFTDSTFTWQKTYSYHATAVAVIAASARPDVQVESDDTPEIKIFAADVFPPAVPAGLEAVASGPGQQTFIDLVWAPVTDLDLDGYNVYRHEAGSQSIRLNSQPVKSPAFRDTTVLRGHTYSYSVSAIDVRGNESAPSEEASESVPQ